MARDTRKPGLRKPYVAKARKSARRKFCPKAAKAAKEESGHFLGGLRRGPALGAGVVAIPWL
eukprot:1939870-Prymnesium_polylepis.1